MKLFETPDFFQTFRANLQGGRIVDLGCGDRKLIPGALGIDLFPGEGVDVLHDLNQFPYPVEAESCDAVILNHVIEHLADPLPVIHEVLRILKPGGHFWLATPHFTDADSWADPTHKYHFSIRSFNRFRKQFDFKLAYVAIKGRWKSLGYERWVNADGLEGRTGKRINRWEAKHCFTRRGGEMMFWMIKKQSS